VSFELRPVLRQDVPSVIALVRRTLDEFGITFGVGAETDAQLEALPGSYTSVGGAFFVACEGEALLGTAGIAPVEAGVFELRKMYLDPKARGGGMAQALFDACIAPARTHEARMVVLDTTEQMTRAIRFYERNGFVRDDAQRRSSRCSRGYRLDL
jgi:GNAT superfamily N-acetyltransferase